MVTFTKAESGGTTSLEPHGILFAFFPQVFGFREDGTPFEGLRVFDQSFYDGLPGQVLGFQQLNILVLQVLCLVVVFHVPVVLEFLGHHWRVFVWRVAVVQTCEEFVRDRGLRLSHFLQLAALPIDHAEDRVVFFANDEAQVYHALVCVLNLLLLRAHDTMMA